MLPAQVRGPALRRGPAPQRGPVVALSIHQAVGDRVSVVPEVAEGFPLGLGRASIAHLPYPEMAIGPVYLALAIARACQAQAVAIVPVYLARAVAIVPVCPAQVVAIVRACPAGNRPSAAGNRPSLPGAG